MNVAGLQQPQHSTPGATFNQLRDRRAESDDLYSRQSTDSAKWDSEYSAISSISVATGLDFGASEL